MLLDNMLLIPGLLDILSENYCHFNAVAQQVIVNKEMGHQKFYLNVGNTFAPFIKTVHSLPYIHNLYRRSCSGYEPFRTSQS